MKKPDTNREPAATLFGKITETDRKKALDVLGRVLMERRDAAIQHWDTVFAEGGYPPWDRLLVRHPDMSEDTLGVLREVLPHIVDTVLYHILDALESTRDIRVSVLSDGKVFDDVARLSWGLASEPVGEDGWLVRFSKQRFEQPV